MIEITSLNFFLIFKVLTKSHWFLILSFKNVTKLEKSVLFYCISCQCQVKLSLWICPIAAFSSILVQKITILQQTINAWKQYFVFALFFFFVKSIHCDFSSIPNTIIYHELLLSIQRDKIWIPKHKHAFNNLIFVKIFV